MLVFLFGAVFAHILYVISDMLPPQLFFIAIKQKLT